MLERDINFRATVLSSLGLRFALAGSRLGHADKVGSQVALAFHLASEHKSFCLVLLSG